MARQLGKFALRRVLGRGASGTVYLALDTFSGDEVALKVLSPEVVGAEDVDKSHTIQFLNEASLAGRISHPHIASILEAAVQEEGGGYIAIEYVPGGDLAQFTASGLNSMSRTRSRSRSSAAVRSTMRTARASCTGTSSRRTSWCRPGPTSRSSTSARRAC
jgi:serine/threonine protein kinase